MSHSMIFYISCMLLFARSHNKQTDVRSQNLLYHYCSVRNLFQCIIEHRIGEACCAGCSCRPDCTLLGNCCDRPIFQDDLTKSGTIKCMHPDTRKRKLSIINIPMHQFVVGPPQGGCGELGSCNTTKQLMTFKTFQPIFSKQKMMNYINDDCARCHGVTDGKKWFSRLAVSSFISFDMINLVEFLMKYQSNYVFVIYEHPGKGSEQIQTICSEDTTELCNNKSITELNVPYDLSSLNTSVEDVKHDCINRIGMPKDSRLQNLYINEWCDLCGSFETFLSENVCQFESNRHYGLAFSTLFEHSFIDRIDKEAKLQTLKIACRPSGMTQEKCREVHCPSMQVRAPDGECVYPTKHWYLGMVSVYLNLTTKHFDFNDTSFTNLSDNSVMGIFRKRSPWNEYWTIVPLGKRSYSSGDQEQLEFILHLYCFVDVVDPRLLMMSIEKSVSSPWVIDIGNKDLTFKQRFAPYPIFLLRPYQYVPMWYIQLKRGFGEEETINVSNIYVPHWDKILENAAKWTFQEKMITITKLFFCSQIALNESDYHLDRNLHLVEMVSEKKILFQLEILLSQLITNTVNVCIEDTDYEIVSLPSNGVCVKKADAILVFVFCVAIHLGPVLLNNLRSFFA